MPADQWVNGLNFGKGLLYTIRKGKLFICCKMNILQSTTLHHHVSNDVYSFFIFRYAFPFSKIKSWWMHVWNKGMFQWYTAYVFIHTTSHWRKTPSKIPEDIVQTVMVIYFHCTLHVSDISSNMQPYQHQSCWSVKHVNCKRCTRSSNRLSEDIVAELYNGAITTAIVLEACGGFP